jgi:hypothetical protein
LQFKNINYDDLIKDTLHYNIEIDIIKVDKPLLIGGCPAYDGKIHIKGLIGIYSEPIIEFIHDMCTTYYFRTLKQKNIELKQERYLYPFIFTRDGLLLDPKMPDRILKLYYNNIITKLNTYFLSNPQFAKIINILTGNGTFTFKIFQQRIYKKVIMIRHIISHPFVHNGINSLDLLIKAGNIILPRNLVLEMEHLQFIHSYLHTLDMLNMIRPELINKNMRSYNLLAGCFTNSVYHICYEQILKTNQFLFLDPKENILPAAIFDKLRYYKLRYSQIHQSELHIRYYEQLINHKIIDHPKLLLPIGFDSYKMEVLKQKYPEMIDILRKEFVKTLSYTKFKQLIKDKLNSYNISPYNIAFIAKLVPQYYHLPNISYVDENGDDNILNQDSVLYD